jgi:hypothetical protein
LDDTIERLIRLEGKVDTVAGSVQHLTAEVGKQNGRVQLLELNMAVAKAQENKDLEFEARIAERDRRGEARFWRGVAVMVAAMGMCSGILFGALQFFNR